MSTFPTDIDAVVLMIRDIRFDLARLGIGQIGVFGSFIRYMLDEMEWRKITGIRGRLIQPTSSKPAADASPQN